MSGAESVKNAIVDVVKPGAQRQSLLIGCCRPRCTEEHLRSISRHAAAGACLPCLSFLLCSVQPCTPVVGLLRDSTLTPLFVCIITTNIPSSYSRPIGSEYGIAKHYVDVL